MSSPTHIPLEKALETRFESSTSSELREYLGQLGEKFDSTDDQNKLRKAVLSAMGLVDVTGANARVARTNVAVPNDSVTPPYNLTPNGLWGGRRVRVKLPRPEGAKLARAEPISWNGKATYWLAYDQVEAIPEPIYQVLLDRKRKHISAQKIPNPDGSVEITTKFEFSNIPLEVIGIDPLTADRAGSMTEWYQNKKPSWFKKRNTRELQTICAKLEIPTVKADVNKTSKSDEEMIGDIFVFLWSHFDVSDADEAEKKSA